MSDPRISVAFKKANRAVYLNKELAGMSDSENVTKNVDKATQLAEADGQANNETGISRLGSSSNQLFGKSLVQPGLGYSSLASPTGAVSLTKPSPNIILTTIVTANSLLPRALIKTNFCSLVARFQKYTTVSDESLTDIMKVTIIQYQQRHKENRKRLKKESRNDNRRHQRMMKVIMMTTERYISTR